ncbi:hypothetical protein IQ63_06310 [Streptomyces acidiscabies]|uniref:Uncharacterized protein n=1 Tax=Streptomyces acidiscabies TaxID=42234 RepID=A0A0L0KLD0_9ACTN|nr:hypothetical protein IQ63_06310 [Streptomyces acidiscabies]
MIAEFSGDNGDDLTAALTECACRCTPDLAFRLLLRALSSKDSATASTSSLVSSGIPYGRALCTGARPYGIGYALRELMKVSQTGVGTVSIGPPGFLLSRMGTTPGRWSETSTQSPPLVLL